MHPILIDLGFFELPSYGVMIATAVLLGLWTLHRRALHAGLDATRTVDLTVWLVIWALVGAKALLVIVELPRYLAHPAEMLGLLRAGGVFLGGLLAALIAGVVLVQRYRLPPLRTLDTMIPSLALGQAIGRVGCLLAGCCWGASCDLPWAITYSDPVAATRLGTPLHQPLHPFPVYESLFDLALYGLLAWWYRRRPAPGRVLATYLGAYGAGRALLELTRGDAARGFVLDGLLSTSQAISLGLIVVSIAMHLWISRRDRR